MCLTFNKIVETEAPQVLFCFKWGLTFITYVMKGSQRCHLDLS